MKEQRFFYCPDLASGQLPEEEARHALRVLRLGLGDTLWLMDGRGCFHEAVISMTTSHRCFFEIQDTVSPDREWNGTIHLAMAPTKHLDRTEWLAEKATEIGIDRLTFLDCQFSERHVVKTERIDKILVSAMKQSHKAWKPVLNEMTDFKAFLQEIEKQEKPMQKFICHCHEEEGLGEKVMLKDAVKGGEDVLVLVGPEGDFSIDEVKMAEAQGFQSVSLGKSRLRTETAALVAVHIMNLINQ